MEKADKDLFCVEKAATKEDSLPLKLRRRNKPLRSEAHINVNLRTRANCQLSKKQSKQDASSGRREEKLAPQLKALLGVVDSSEEEQDYDVSARYSARRRSEETEVARISTRRLKKTTFKPPLKDIWAHSEQGTVLYTVCTLHLLHVHVSTYIYTHAERRSACLPG